MILEMIATYLMIGVVFVIVVDWTTNYAKKVGLPVSSDSDWDEQTKLLAIIIWPLGLLFFLKGYIQERFFNNKNNNK